MPLLNRIKKTRPATLLCLLLLANRLEAQTDSIGTVPYTVIKINFQKQRLEPYYLPFDVPFVLAAPAADSLGIDAIDVTCKSTGRAGAQQTIFTKTLKKDLFFKDTIYQNITSLLKPAKAYHFNFLVHRGITAKEDSALIILVRPGIKKDLTGIYNGTSQQGGDTLLEKALNSATGLCGLINDLRTQINSYYTKKNLSIATQIDAAVDAAHVKQFVSKLFYGPMTAKRSALEQISGRMTDIVNSYQNMDSGKINMSGWELFRLLDLYADSLHIDPATKKFVHNVMRDFDTLHLGIHALKSKTDPEIFDAIGAPSPAINGYVSLADAFTNNCVALANSLKDLAKDPAPFERLVKRLFPQTAREEAEKKTVSNEFNIYLNQYLPAIQKLDKYIQIYYADANDLDSAYAKAEYHLKTEFEIEFADNTVGLTSADFVTRGQFYVIADIGFAYINASPAALVRPYVGVEFNLYPMNRDAEYSLLKPSPQGYTFLGNVFRNLSVNVGVTVFNSFTAKDKYYDLFGTTGSLLLGMSLRLTSGIRVSGGACMVYKKDPNPLSDQKSLAGLGYGAMSIDLKLKQWLGGLFGIFWK